VERERNQTGEHLVSLGAAPRRHFLRGAIPNLLFFADAVRYSSWKAKPPMKTFFACVALALASFVSLHAADRAKEVSLFDGKTFQGWEGDTNKSFRIQDGAIVGGTLSAKIPRNEFLCSTRNYTNFVLRLKFKLVGKGANAGVQLRTKRIPNHHEVSGYQADMGDPSWWGCLYDESRRNKVLAQSKIEEVNKVLKREDWNEYTMRCEGKRIRLFVNGLETIDYTEMDPKIEDYGVIAVQIHSGPPSEAWYKDIFIQELP
jgi:hypothetical protein